MIRFVLPLVLLALAPAASFAQPKPAPKEPPATDPATMKTLKDFKVELIYSVPKDEQGSWVSMTVDDKGRARHDPA